MPMSVAVRAILNRFNWGNLPYVWGAPAQELGSVTKLKRESAWCQHSSPCLWAHTQCDKPSQTLTLSEHDFLPWFLKKYSSQSYRHGSTCLSSWCLGGGDKKTEFNASFSCIISRLSWLCQAPPHTENKKQIKASYCPTRSQTIPFWSGTAHPHTLKVLSTHMPFDNLSKV